MTTIALDDYLQALASDQPTPGGGAATALTAAQAAALLAMVARISDAPMSLVDELDGFRKRFSEFAEQDEQAFGTVMQALRMPRASAEQKTQREQQLKAALWRATEVPLLGMETVVKLMDAAGRTLAVAKPSVISDAGIALELLHAALLASRYTVLVNLKYLKDDAFAAQARANMQRAIEHCSEQRAALSKVVLDALQ